MGLKAVHIEAIRMWLAGAKKAEIAKHFKVRPKTVTEWFHREDVIERMERLQTASDETLIEDLRAVRSEFLESTTALFRASMERLMAKMEADPKSVNSKEVAVLLREGRELYKLASTQTGVSTVQKLEVSMENKALFELQRQLGSLTDDDLAAIAEE